MRATGRYSHAFALLVCAGCLIGSTGCALDGKSTCATSVPCQTQYFAPSPQSPPTPPVSDDVHVLAPQTPDQVQLVAYQADEQPTQIEAELEAEVERIPPGMKFEPERPTYPITLDTALELAVGRNPKVMFARERWRESLARVEAADVLWLPSLRAGFNWDKHEGAIQEVRGGRIDTSRGSMYGGLGANAVGAGTTSIHGISANFHLADAWFQPLATRQQAIARARGTAAANNDIMLDAALGYLELLRAGGELEIFRKTEAHARQLAHLTIEFARTGQGVQADADRAMTELMLRENTTTQAEEALRVASARLAQTLRLDPTIQIDPVEPLIAPVEIVPPIGDVNELVATALSNRPELSEQRALVAEAITLWRRQRYSPFIPSVMLGTSYGTFGAGLGGDLNFSDRFDFDAVAWWEVKNLGFGELAAREQAQARVRQANAQQIMVMDQVAREVVEAYTQVEYRRRQIEVARRAEEAAVASHERNMKRITDAVGLPIEALQSIRALDTARREHLRAIIDFNQAQFRLQRALGWPG